MLNSSTIYNKKIKVWEQQIDTDILSVRAVQIPNGDMFYSNIMIMDSIPDVLDMTIFLDKDDAIELAGDIMHVIKNFGKEDAIATRTYKTTLASGVKVEYHIQVSCPTGEFVRMDTSLDEDRFGDNADAIMFMSPYSIAEDFAKAMVEAADQAGEMLEANKNLDKQMKDLKMDMKNNKVKELHFDVLDDMPEVYSENNQFVRIYEITPYNYDDKPTGYSFYRMLHLTNVPQVDFRDYGEEFLHCPFVYSDKMIELGKEFLKRKHDQLHEYVDNKKAEQEAQKERNAENESNSKSGDEEEVTL